MELRNLEKGITTIKNLAKKMPDSSGVYKMISESSEILYVGKAKILSKRVLSYSNPMKLNVRLQNMVSLVRNIEFITTEDEANALLLESSLIKETKPKFNILLKDDKTYPNIVLRKSHVWPQIKKHRGKKTLNDRYFGPFASAGHVNTTLNILQKVFPLRTCSDYEIQNRKRPCIQYQIKRCLAPCTGNVSNDDYSALVKSLESYFAGKDSKIINNLITKMSESSKNLSFEEAAQFRDKIRALEKISGSKKTEWREINTADIFCFSSIENWIAIEVIFCRNGQSFGSITHYPINVIVEEPKIILEKFIVQFYHNRTPPEKIIISHNIEDKSLLEKALKIKNKEQVKILIPYDKATSTIVNMGLDKAKKNLANKIALKEKTANLHSILNKKFKLNCLIERVEVYDNSHFSGKEAIGSYIVANNEGFEKESYRKFKIKESNSKDDYAMLKEVLNRRLKNINNLPDLLIIDGGKGQLSAAKNVIKLKGLKKIKVISISKGKMRNSNNEKFYNDNGFQIILNNTDPLFHYLQRLRDEAHRFAITSHQQLRRKKLFSSEIDMIEDIGPKRKKNLLLYYGSVHEIKNASFESLQRVPNINKKVAEKIFNYFKIK